MFAPSSLQKSYVFVSSFDPALDLPEIPELLEGASAEDVAAHEKLMEECTHKLKIARETGQWQRIVKAGDSPTLFRFRQVHGSRLTWFQGERQRRSLSNEESYELMFRLALEGIENFGKLTIEFDPITEREPFKLVKLKSLAPIYDIGRDAGKPRMGFMIICELGALVLARAVQGIDPLS